MKASTYKQLDATTASMERMISAMQAKARRIDAGIEAKAIDAQLRQYKNTPVTPGTEFKSVIDYLRTGEVKATASVVANPADAGVLAIGEPVRRVFQIMKDNSPIIQHAEVIDIAANVAQLPVETDVGDVEWVGETQTRAESLVSLGQVNIPVNEAVYTKAVSNVLLEDSNVVNIEDYLTTSAGTILARGVGKAFVSGDGDRKPMGLFTSPRLETVQSGKANGVTFKGLTNAIGSIPNAAESNAKWFMSRQTFWNIVSEFGTESSYVNIPLTSDIPPAILGYPVVFVDAPALTTGNVAAVFGDVYQAYKVVQRRAMSFLRDPYTNARRGMTDMIFSVRIGGDLVMPDSVVGIKVGA